MPKDPTSIQSLGCAHKEGYHKARDACFFPSLCCIFQSSAELPRAPFHGVADSAAPSRSLLLSLTIDRLWEGRSTSPACGTQTFSFSCQALDASEELRESLDQEHKEVGRFVANWYAGDVSTTPYSPASLPCS